MSVTLVGGRKSASNEKQPTCLAQEYVKGGPIQVATPDHNGSDLLRVSDVVERIRFKLHRWRREFPPTAGRG